MVSYIASALLFSASLLSASSTVEAAPAQSVSRRCSDLSKLNLPNVTILVNQRYPEGTNFSARGTPFFSPAYTGAVPNLAAFCRYAANISTSETSSVLFEVWLPEENWSGRFAMMGNGGDAGGVNYPDMGVPLTKYRFAVASTNTGHNSTGYDGSFAIKGPETQIDFGYRAVHLTAMYSKEIVRAYYGGSGAKYNYWLGCSSGGKQGLKELQLYPRTFDGVLAGAAAQWWTHLNGQTYRINAYVNPLNSSGHLTPGNYQTIGAEVLRQCDVLGLDTLKDGIIVDPTECKPDLTTLLCSRAGANTTTCLNADQVKTMQAIYADWVTNIASGPGGTNWFPGFEPGAEASPSFSVSGVPFGPGPDYLNYQVQNNTAVAPFVVPNEAAFNQLVVTADETDPGQTNAIEPNIKPFLQKGKLITYVGLADTLIPTGSTLLYHDRVKAALGNFPTEKSFRLFAVPGMGHCSGGPGAWNFGTPLQRDISLGGPLQSETFDKSHDMILALIAWTEKNQAPDEIISVSYKNADKRQGVAFERKLCVWPKLGYYQGGDQTKATSFACK